MLKKFCTLVVAMTLIISDPVLASGPPINQGTTGNKTLTANWNPITYSITYNLGGGTNNVSNPLSYNITTSSFTLTPH